MPLMTVGMVAVLEGGPRVFRDASVYYQRRNVNRQFFLAAEGGYRNEESRADPASPISQTRDGTPSSYAGQQLQLKRKKTEGARLSGYN